MTPLAAPQRLDHPQGRDDNRVSFIGIGAQKCATTWLYGVLQLCPDVRVSHQKEVDFFSAYFDRGYEWYARQIAQGPARQRGEISPSYFIHPDAAARAHAYNPDLQILVILRDPVRRAWSNHLHEVRKGHVTGRNLGFEAALENNPLYRDQGRYATHLARWFDVFPAGQIHVVFQEDIHADSRAVANRVAVALGLPPPEQGVHHRANESVRYRNPAVGDLLSKAGTAARRRGFAPMVDWIKASPVIRQIHQANRQDVSDLVAPMTPATEAALTAFYAPEVAALETMIGRTVPWPRFTAIRGKG